MIICSYADQLRININQSNSEWKNHIKDIGLTTTCIVIVRKIIQNLGYVQHIVLI